MKRPYFQFKQFDIYHDECAMKVGTDGVLVGAWANVTDAQNILDIGTGTGLITIMAAQRNSTAQITGIDIDESAYRQALKNAKLCKWQSRIKIKHSSLQNFLTEENKLSFQSIVSNPPYFNAGTQAPNNKRQTARHTQSLSYQELIEGVNHLLADNGKFSVILPHQEGLLFQKIASQFQLYLSRITNVHSKKGKPTERLLQEFQKRKQPLQKEKLIIQHEARNDWTTEYVLLTQSFYLKM